MNADRIAIYERLDKLDDENFSKIIELADVIEQKQKEDERSEKSQCIKESFDKIHEILSSEPCPWESEEEMIEELKEDRRKRAGMSFEEFHRETKELAKSFGIEID